jgi:hypothetical protein
MRLRLRYPARNRNTDLFLTNLAFTLLDDLDQILLDRFLERARDLVSALELLALGGSHCDCGIGIVIVIEVDEWSTSLMCCCMVLIEILKV